MAKHKATRKNTKKVDKNTKDKTSWWEEKKSLIFLLGKFLLGMVVFLILTNNNFYSTQILPKIMALNASLASFLLNIFGFGTSVNFDVISSPGTSISVKKGCDAIAPIAIFSVMLLAYSSALKDKWKGLIIGIAALLAINVIRIASLFVFKVYASSLFDTMHLVVWQVLFIFLVLLFFFFWLRSLPENTLEAIDE